MTTIEEAVAQNGVPFAHNGKQYILLEYDQKTAHEEARRSQIEAMDQDFRKSSRINALEIASKLSISSKGLNPLDQNSCKMTDEKIIDASEKIYQWLIKVIE